MKEIKQGTIYNYEIVIKVPDDFPEDDLIVNKNTLEKYIKSVENRELHTWDFKK